MNCYVDLTKILNNYRNYVKKVNYKGKMAKIYKKNKGIFYFHDDFVSFVFIYDLNNSRLMIVFSLFF